MDELISIIVPVYNSELYLDRCIQSILNQSYNEFELILIDDGSTDNSGNICDRYACFDKRIKVLHQNNCGQSKARNVGFAISKGKWICYIDSDDFVNKYYLEVLLKQLQNSIFRMSVCKAKSINENIKGISSINELNVTKININECSLVDLINNDDFIYWTVWGKLIHREIIDEFPFAEDRIYEDNAIVFKWLIKAGNVIHINQELYFYFVNQSSTTNTVFSLKNLDRAWALEEQIKYYSSTNYKLLLDLITKRYILTLADLTNKLAVNRYESVIIKEIRCKLKNTLKKNKTIKLKKEQRLLIFEALHPYLSLIYWKIKAFISK